MIGNIERRQLDILVCEPLVRLGHKLADIADLLSETLRFLLSAARGKKHTIGLPIPTPAR